MTRIQFSFIKDFLGTSGLLDIFLAFETNIYSFKSTLTDFRFFQPLAKRYYKHSFIFQLYFIYTFNIKRSWILVEKQRPITTWDSMCRGHMKYTARKFACYNWLPLARICERNKVLYASVYNIRKIIVQKEFPVTHKTFLSIIIRKVKVRTNG